MLLHHNLINGVRVQFFVNYFLWFTEHQFLLLMLMLFCTFALLIMYVKVYIWINFLNWFRNTFIHVQVNRSPAYYLVLLKFFILIHLTFRFIFSNVLNLKLILIQIGYIKFLIWLIFLDHFNLSLTSLNLLWRSLAILINLILVGLIDDFTLDEYAIFVVILLVRFTARGNTNEWLWNVLKCASHIKRSDGSVGLRLNCLKHSLGNTIFYRLASF